VVMTRQYQHPSSHQQRIAHIKLLTDIRKDRVRQTNQPHSVGVMKAAQEYTTAPSRSQPTCSRPLRHIILIHLRPILLLLHDSMV
jgi:hypothetical protein